MKRFYCDRCGKEIKEDPLRIMSLFSYKSDPSEDISMDMKKKLVQLMQPLEDKDFCIECLGEIIDFALNGKACDECVQQMIEENEKTESDTQGESDSSDLNWDKALNRMERLNHSDGSQN